MKNRTTWSPTRHQNLYRHKSGKLYARISIGGKKTWRSLKTDVISIAKARLAKMQEEEAARKEMAGGQVADGSMTVSDAVVLRLKEIHRDTSLKSGTKKYYEEVILALVKNLGSMSEKDIRQVSVEDCQKWAESYAKKFAPTRFNAALSALRRSFDISIERGLRLTNPASKIKRRSPRKKDLSTKLPNSEEFATLIEEIRNTKRGIFSNDHADLVEFLAYSGLRITEANHVEWGHCDFRRGELLVVGDPVEGTKNSEMRRIPMIPDLRDLLLRLKEQNPDARSRDKVLKATEARDSLKRACKKLGMHRITHHDLRHLFATTCIESGVDIPTVSRWLGHKDGGALAMRVYGHLRNEHSLAAAKKVSFG